MRWSIILTLFFMLWIGLLLGLVFFLIRWLLYKGTEKCRRQGREEAAVRRSLGEALREERSRHSMTQEYVAEALGVSRQAVSKWENGTSDPSTSNLLALAKLYGVDAGELLKNVED